MFGNITLDDSENSSSLPSLSGVQVNERTKKAGPMESIISGDGSCDSENFTNVASGENTAQGVKKPVTEESKNGNPFLDASNGSSQSNRSNRVGPFETSGQDFMIDEMDEGDDDGIDVSELVVEEIQNWNQSHRSSTKSELSSGSRGLLSMVDSTTDTYDGSVNPAGSNKKGYYNLSQNEDRQRFMSNMNGVGGQVPGEQIYNNDEEDQTQDSPLFREDSFISKGRNSVLSRGLSKDNPFAEEDDSLTRIETYKPRSNGLEGSRYASMQELLDEENASPFSAEKRKGVCGCIDKVFGEKRTKRRKITAVSIILLMCGGIAAALYVILATKPADSSDIKGSELVVVPITPTRSPSRGNSPVGPSLMIPSFDLNGSSSDFDNIPLPPTLINGSNATIDGTFTTTTTSIGAVNSTSAPSISPGNESSINVSISFNISVAPTITPAFNESSSPSVLMYNNTSLVPTPQPSIISDDNATLNETTLTPTSPPSIMNVSESLMPSVIAENETESVVASAAPTPVPSLMNVSESLMPSVIAKNKTESPIVASGAPTPAPFITTASESFMPSVIVKNETESPVLTSEAPTPAPSVSSSEAPTPAPSDSFLDELSDPWTLHESFQHDQPSALFGTAVTMSADPLILVVGAKDALNEVGDASGAAYVYSFDENRTASLLQILHGENANDEFGNALAISDDGSRLVIGSRSEADQTGALRIYQLSESTYIQLGSTIIGASEFGRTGWAVSISGDGSTVAVGSPKGGAESGGSVRTYQYDGDWFLFGSEIEGGTDAAVGYSVSLSIDGSVLAVGNPKATNRDGSLNAGKVATYTIVDSEWALADEIFGQASEDVEGTSIALSPDGEFLVTGAKGSNGENGSIESSGSCQLYQNASGRRWRWKNSLIGKSVDERLGSWVSISRDASMFACGGVAAALDGFGTYGVVRTWNRRTSLDAEIWPRAKDSESSSFGSALAFSPLGLAVGAPDYSGGDGGSLAGAVEIYSVG